MSEAESVPPKWNVIIDHSSREYERLKMMEKHKDQLRKMAYRNALDEDLNQKKYMAHDDKQEDRRFFQAMVARNRHAELLQEQKKQQNQRKHQQAAEQNRRLIQQANRSRQVLQFEGMHSLTSIPIGNPEEQSLRRHENKKELLDFYSDYMEQKHERMIMQKNKDKEMLAYQMKIQEQREQERQNERRRILSHQQDQKIYKYYNSLNELGLKKEQDFNRRMVQQAAAHNMQRDIQRSEEQNRQRRQKLQEVKSSLLEQMRKNREAKLQTEKLKSIQKINDKLSEGELSGRGPTYNKEDYFAFLKKQEELHKKQKVQERNMNALEYRMNFQDLKTAVEGGEVHNTSPLYIGYGGEQSNRKDQIYFKYLSAPKSSRTNRSVEIPQDSLDEYQRRMDKSLVQRLKPSV